MATSTNNTNIFSLWRTRPILAWALFFLLQAQAITAQQQNTSAGAVSSLFIRDSNTLISINLPPDNDDINFYMSTPDWYQWTAIGFGSNMADSLMLVMYNAADDARVTVSPRLSTGNTEPLLHPAVEVMLWDGSGIRDHNMVVNGTCRGCRSWPTGSVDTQSKAQPMIFAVGPGGSELSTDDLSAQIKRHIAYGRFTMDMVRATGPGGISASSLPTNGSTASVGAELVDGRLHEPSTKAATAHGVMYALVALGIAPLDTAVAGLLGRWPTLHVVTATFYFLFVVGAMVPGILVSNQQVATQKFATGHQVLGLLTVIVMFGLFAWGSVTGFLKKRAAKKRGEQPGVAAAVDPSPRAKLLSTVHTWTGRLIWLLFLINNGLGLKLSNHSNMFIIGYSVLALGVVIVFLPVYFCIWRCIRRSKTPPKDQHGHELSEFQQQPNIYDHDWQQQQHNNDVYATESQQNIYPQPPQNIYSHEYR